MVAAVSQGNAERTQEEDLSFVVFYLLKKKEYDHGASRYQLWWLGYHESSMVIKT